MNHHPDTHWVSHAALSSPAIDLSLRLRAPLCSQTMGSSSCNPQPQLFSVLGGGGVVFYYWLMLVMIDGWLMLFDYNHLFLVVGHGWCWLQMVIADYGSGYSGCWSPRFVSTSFLAMLQWFTMRYPQPQLTLVLKREITKLLQMHRSWNPLPVWRSSSLAMEQAWMIQFFQMLDMMTVILPEGIWGFNSAEEVVRYYNLPLAYRSSTQFHDLSWYRCWRMKSLERRKTLSLLSGSP